MLKQNPVILRMCLQQTNNYLKKVKQLTRTNQMGLIDREYMTERYSNYVKIGEAVLNRKPLTIVQESYLERLDRTLTEYCKYVYNLMAHCQADIPNAFAQYQQECAVKMSVLERIASVNKAVSFLILSSTGTAKINNYLAEIKFCLSKLE